MPMPTPGSFPATPQCLQRARCFESRRPRFPARRVCFSSPPCARGTSGSRCTCLLWPCAERVLSVCQPLPIACRPCAPPLYVHPVPASAKKAFARNARHTHQRARTSNAPPGAPYTCAHGRTVCLSMLHRFRSPSFVDGLVKLVSLDYEALGLESPLVTPRERFNTRFHAHPAGIVRRRTCKDCSLGFTELCVKTETV